MQTRILIVDDAVEHHQMLKSLFGGQHFLTQTFTLEEARAQLQKSSFDLILMDISLPDGDGLFFYAELHSNELTRSIPVILITNSTEPNKEIMGFSLGVEDYIVKPIDPSRLRARVEARLKQIEMKKNHELIISRGNLKMSVALQKVTILHDNKEVLVDLTPVEFKLLHHFLRHEDQVFTREELLAAVLGKGAAEVTDRIIDMHISNLRKKIVLSDHITA